MVPPPDGETPRVSKNLGGASLSMMVRTAVAGFPNVAPPVGTAESQIHRFIRFNKHVVENRNGDGLVRRIAIGKAHRLRHGGVVGTSRRRAIARCKMRSHGPSASSRPRDRDRRAAAIFVHAVGRRAELQRASQIRQISVHVEDRIEVGIRDPDARVQLRLVARMCSRIVYANGNSHLSNCRPSTPRRSHRVRQRS